MRILQVKNLIKKYGKINAVDDLSFDVNKGEVFGILGPNGSGKTTTLAIVLGLVLQNSGTFKWFDYPENQTINKKIGTLIEQPNFFPNISAYNNMKLIAQIREITNPEKEIEHALEIVGLWQRRNYAFSTYSLGMKRRLAIAGTLLGNPPVLILDEPTNGLDPQGIAFVRNLILEQAKAGKTIILASHLLDEVEKICSNVLILNKGKKITEGKVADIMHENKKIAVASDNDEKLYELIVKNGLSEKIYHDDNKMIITLKPEIDKIEISRIAAQNNILITNIEECHSSLENEYLKLVDKDNSSVNA
jgi:ABC-2 type transport system ATP-binding protein